MADGGGEEVTSSSATQATWRSLFASREFLAVWASRGLSLVGDQLTRVAVTILVYDRTGSPLLTAAAYALSYVPWLIGGPLLSGLADRYPRRLMMIICDVASTVLVALMALSDLPLAVLCALLFLVVLIESPFTSARAALLVDILPDDRYVLASALMNMTVQIGQVVGFAVGGALVALLGTQPALLIDAGTFLGSALLVKLFVANRPTPRAGQPTDPPSWWVRMTAGAKLITGDPRLRSLLFVAMLATFWVVPEGLAAPYIHDLNGTSPAAIGLYLAAQPTGAALGYLIIGRMFGPARRLELVGPLALLSCLPLIGCALHPDLIVTLLLLVLSGMGTSYNVPANAAFMQIVPADSRGQAFGLVSTALIAGQGISMALGGAAANFLSAPVVIAIVGGLGTVAAARAAATNRKVLAAILPTLN